MSAVLVKTEADAAPAGTVEVVRMVLVTGAGLTADDSGPTADGVEITTAVVTLVTLPETMVLVLGTSVALPVTDELATLPVLVALADSVVVEPAGAVMVVVVLLLYEIVLEVTVVVVEAATLPVPVKLEKLVKVAAV